MARLTKPLTDTEIKAAKPQAADYTLHDGDGLQLLIKSSGRRVWQMRYYRPLTKKRAKPRQPMNSQTVNAALKRAGLGGILVSHGMRSIASTTLNEQGFPSDVIEAALAHVDKNEVRRAYNRSDYLEQRRPMMQWWAEFVSTADSGSVMNEGIKGLRVL